MTQDDDESSRRDPEARKERVLHTRVPAVLDQELKRLARNLRVPVSNVVRAILEDAVDAVDTVGERAEGGLMGFVDRLSRQRDELRHRMVREPGADEAEDEDAAEPAEPEPETEAAPVCAGGASELLEGVYGYQPLILATATSCAVCGRALPVGSEAHRALFDEPGRKAFLGPDCRLLPGKENGS